jgi:hypothetical protein
MRSSIALRAISLAALPGAAILGLVMIPMACGNEGEPAFAGPDGTVTCVPTSTPPPDEDAQTEVGPPLVPLHGRVEGPEGGPLVALIAIEVGGLNQEPPGAIGDGGVKASMLNDPYYTYGTTTVEAGTFSLNVPDEKNGVHVYASGYSCDLPDAEALVPGKHTLVFLPSPLAAGEGGALPAKPSITGFTVTPQVIPPGEALTMAAVVKAPDPHDPLSEQVVAIEPSTGWAGALAPPTPGIWGKGYPNGVYSRLVIAPTVPGEYIYYLVAATEACVVSEPVTARVVVSLTDSGLDADAEPPTDAPP